MNTIKQHHSLQMQVRFKSTEEMSI
uniref:Uncharacterized protein n=1 Tax=Rhizophora mucronata TaxID=61149 RepID=A0A2P2LPP7_RHIMU